MWGIKKTIYDRQNNIIKSAIQKYARRCDYHKMSRCCLELLYQILKKYSLQTKN